MAHSGIGVHSCNKTIVFECPHFTKLERDDYSGTYSCEYDVWFYGVAATLFCFGALFPIILLICCWAKWKNSSTARKKLHRQDSDASTHTDMSRPHDHGVYEILRDEDSRNLYFRTRREGPYQKRYGTFSVPDFKAFNATDVPHLYPDLTRVESQSMPTSPTAESKNSSARDVNVDKSSSTSCLKTSNERHVDSVMTSNVYENKKSMSEQDIQIQCNSEKRSSKDNSIDPELERYQNELEKSSSTESVGLIIKHTSTIPKKIIVPQAHIKKLAKSEENEVKVHFPSFQPTPPIKHLVERLDFDHYLHECVSKLPEDQRNGTFLIRDSQSRPGCKVLTVYCKGLEPTMTLYHYQICFDKDDKVFIPGCKDFFADIEELMDFYKNQRTFLPCLLSNCLGKNF